jgi:hypothetical protein
MITQELKEHLEAEGYSELREIEGRGVCGVFRFLFTVGIVLGIDSTGYKGRYCYGSHIEASFAINLWDGQSDPPGDWIKYKGEGGERTNDQKECYACKHGGRAMHTCMKYR